MSTKLDTLFYTFALKDEDKASGTVLEDMASISKEQKILGLLEAHTNMVVETAYRYDQLQQALSDISEAIASFPELTEADSGDDDMEISNAVAEVPEVQDLFDDFERAEQGLLSFEQKLATAVAGE